MKAHSGAQTLAGRGRSNRRGFTGACGVAKPTDFSARGKESLR